jgi:hypothetical protein
MFWMRFELDVHQTVVKSVITYASLLDLGDRAMYSFWRVRATIITHPECARARSSWLSGMQIACVAICGVYGFTLFFHIIS